MGTVERIFVALASVATVIYVLGSIWTLRFAWLGNLRPYLFVAAGAWGLLLVFDYFALRRSVFRLRNQVHVMEEHIQREESTRSKAIEAVYETMNTQLRIKGN